MDRESKLKNAGFMFIVFLIATVAVLVVSYFFPEEKTLSRRIMESLRTVVPIFIVLYFATIGVRKTILRSAIYSFILSALFFFAYLSITSGVGDMLWIAIILSLGVGIFAGGLTAAIIYFNPRKTNKNHQKSRKVSSEILTSVLIGAGYIVAVVGFYDIPAKTALLRGILLAIFAFAMIQLGWILRKTLFE